MTATPFIQPISEQIWNGKYKLVTDKPGIQNDRTVTDTWYRIATACADVSPKVYGEVPFVNFDEYSDHMFTQYMSILKDFKFLPAGRITAGAGSDRNVTLFNCFVMGTIPDDMGGIFDMLKEAALTMQQGGGIGYDFSPIRPKGAPVRGVDADASGSISFMNVWDRMCRTIMSAGSRRGAMMATMRCTHPDVIDFIEAKREVGTLNMFNMSILCTDAFMKAVKDDDDWALTHSVKPKNPTFMAVYDGEKGGVTKQVDMIGDEYIYEVVSAKDLWELIMQNTYDHADPGVLFIDRINKMNNLNYMETISATNPCGEQPLPPYGACLLGSINLSRMVKNAFYMYTPYDKPYVDYAEIARVAAIAVRMLDSVIDVSNFPLEAQRQEALEKRRMGIGITGLGDLLYMMGITYGSRNAIKITEQITRTIAIATYQESIKLAREFGPCPATETFEQRAAFCKSGNMQNMPSEIRDEIMSYGIRNALLTSIAPTGTISLYAGNVSSGVEPIFSPGYKRRILEDDGVTERFEAVTDYAVILYNRANGLPDDDQTTILKEPWCVSAQTLTPDDHLRMQAAAQKWVDSSISKTINLPEEISFDDFTQVYLDAYDYGCKGCTTYRPNDTIGSVLSIEPEKEEENLQHLVEDVPVKPENTGPMPRDRVVDGQTYKLKWAGHNYYVTINNVRDAEGKLIPFEIFINTQDMSNFQWVMGMTRMISSVFRRGGDVSFVVEDLKMIKDPNGGNFVEGKYQHSFLAYLGQIIQEHLEFLAEGTIFTQTVAIHDLDPFEPEITEADLATIAEWERTSGSPADQCPECGEYAMTNTGGCPVCSSCGHSKCG